MINIKSQWELDRMRRSGQVAAEILGDLARALKPGVATIWLDKKAEGLIKSKGAESAFLGYHGYPRNICISINEEVVHGIGTARKIREGDIVSLDVGVKFGGYVGDVAATFPVGRISAEKSDLIEAAAAALAAGIEQARTGSRLYDISAAIQKTAEKAGYSVVRDYVGHGIGMEMHEDPQVPNYGRSGTGPLLRAGMVLAIEPMLVMGKAEVEVGHDSWTVSTRDRKPAAHFEHTVAITEDGPEILT